MIQVVSLTTCNFERLSIWVGRPFIGFSIELRSNIKT